MTAPLIITIIGAGRIGRTLGALIATPTTGYEARWWDTDPARRSPGYATLDQALSGARLVLCAVPSTAFPDLLATLVKLPTTTPIVTISKGAPSDTFLSPVEWLIHHLPQHTIVALGGPMMAEELSADQPGQAVIASDSASAREQIKTIFEAARIACSVSDKPIDVSRSGVLKNVYACAVGMIDGADLPSAAHQRGHTIARQEFFIAGQALNIDGDVLGGPAGIGDFTVTIESPHSRNRRSGEELIRQHTHDHSAEALHSFTPIISAVGHTHALPLLHAAGAIVAGTQTQASLHQLTATL